MGLVAKCRLIKTTRLEQPFLTAGDRLYVFASQDGGFPDLGWHTAGEMGGIWAHPFKILDGFWLQVNGAWLERGHRFVSGAFWSEVEYELPQADEHASPPRVVRRLFVPDGRAELHIRYTFFSSRSQTLALRFLARSDLRDVWPERPYTDAVDGAIFDRARSAWTIQRPDRPLAVHVGAPRLDCIGHATGPDLWGPEMTAGHGTSVALDYQLAVRGEEAAELEMVVAAYPLSPTSRAATVEEDVFIAGSSFPSSRWEKEPRPDRGQAWHAKAARYEEMLSFSRLDIPDHAITVAWDWLKCNNDWLVRSVPGIGRGLGAGAPEYVWWFGCDTAYSCLGCLALGQHDLAIETLDLLRELSVAGNGDCGRVIHECNTRGETIHHGCVEETAAFVSAVWQTFCWTGDEDFLRRNYPFCRRGLLDWILSERRRGSSLLPWGYGIMELFGLDQQCLDTACFTATALGALAGMADVFDETDTARLCRERREELAAEIQAAFWMEEEGLYGDVVAAPRVMAPRFQSWIERVTAEGGEPGILAELQDLLRQAQTDPHPDRLRPWLLKSWTILCPLEASLAPPERAQRVLARMESPEFTTSWGPYVNAVFRQASMSVNAGVAAMAEITYGRPEAGVRCISRVAEGLPCYMPGAIAEITPDGGCAVQAWSGYALAWPLVSGVFGLRPDAHGRRLEVRPSFPAGWTRAALRRLRIGNALFDVVWDVSKVDSASGDVSDDARRSGLSVTCSEPGWTIIT